MVERRTPEREVGGFETYLRRVGSLSKTLYSKKVLVIKGANLGVIGMCVRASILKPTPIIYPAFEKYDLFNVDIFVCCPLILYRSACSVCCLYSKFSHKYYNFVSIWFAELNICI